MVPLSMFFVLSVFLDGLLNQMHHHIKRSREGTMQTVIGMIILAQATFFTFHTGVLLVHELSWQ